MKVAIVSKYDKTPLKKILREFDFKMSNNPEIVIAYGGDGTILYSERKFPGIPKIIVKRSSKIFRKYDYSFNELKKILKRVKEGNYKIIEEMKLEANFKGRKLTALNEIQLHNKFPGQAIRFSFFVGGRKIRNLIGDGMIISTPFGSTAYYSSTGGKPFKKGIGISFNNLFRKKVKSFVVGENSKIKVKVEKGIGIIVADNSKKYFEIREGENFVVKKAKEKAKFILV